jgi:hypothetical protein
MSSPPEAVCAEAHEPTFDEAVCLRHRSLEADSAVLPSMETSKSDLQVFRAAMNGGHAASRGSTDGVMSFSRVVGRRQAGRQAGTEGRYHN